jgi:hypothetical protein
MWVTYEWDGKRMVHRTEWQILPKKFQSKRLVPMSLECKEEYKISNLFCITYTKSKNNMEIKPCNSQLFKEFTENTCF